MKFTQLTLGGKYRTKIGREYQLVQLINLRHEFNVGKQDRDKEVIVLTGAGNQIYRTASQLKPE